MNARIYLTGLSEIREGGSYHRFRRMLRALDGHGITVHVITTSPALEGANQNNIKWHQICSFGPLALRTYLYFMCFFPCCLYWILARQIKTIVVFGPIYAALLLPLRIFSNRRIFCMVRGMLSREMTYQKRNFAIIKGIVFLEMLGFKVSNRIIVVSKTLAEDVKHQYRQKEGKIFYLPNEIPSIVLSCLENTPTRSLWKTTPENPFLRILTGGVITRIKYFESLLYAASKLKIPYHIIIAGKPSQKDDMAYFKFLKEVAENKGIDRHVSWAGWLEKEALVKTLGESDLFISTSHHEGMSNLLLEALALDVPCFAKNSPESVELLKNESLVFDSPDGLSEMISRFYQKGDFYKQVKEFCKQAGKSWSFNWEEQLMKAFS